MAPRSKKTKSKLGHDPLAWLGDEPAPGTDVMELEAVSKEEAPVKNETASEKIEELITESESADLSSKEDTGKENSKGNSMLELPIYFGIAQVGEVYEKMKSAVENSGDVVEIKADDIESIDTAALQLLLVFINQVKVNGKQIKLTEFSEKLKAAIELLGVDSSFT